MKKQTAPVAPASPVSLAWSGRALQDSLVQAALYLEAALERQIGWYQGKKRSKARTSRALRAGALVAFIAGGLTPLAGMALPGLLGQAGVELGGLASLLIGGATACLAFDRFFGCSSTWLRYVTAAMALESQLERFRYEWPRRSLAAGEQLSAGEAERLLRFFQETAAAMRRTVEEETSAWVAEFQSNLLRLERDLAARSAPPRRKAA